MGLMCDTSKMVHSPPTCTCNNEQGYRRNHDPQCSTQVHDMQMLETRNTQLHDMQMLDMGIIQALDMQMWDTPYMVDNNDFLFIQPTNVRHMVNTSQENNELVDSQAFEMWWLKFETQLLDIDVVVQQIVAQVGDTQIVKK